MKQVKKFKYEGLSLVEMLITLIIVGLVIVVVSSTLAALIKASAIAQARTLSRSESEFVMELLERYTKNTEVDEVYVYNVISNGPPTGRYVTLDGDIYAPPIVNASQILPGTGGIGNEVHFRPIGSTNWICIGYVPAQDSTPTDPKGYIIKSTATSNSTNCINSTNPAVFLNSNEIEVLSFAAKYYQTTSGNFTYIYDLDIQPTHWIPGPESAFKPNYPRQVIVNTSKLTY